MGRRQRRMALEQRWPSPGLNEPRRCVDEDHREGQSRAASVASPPVILAYRVGSKLPKEENSPVTAISVSRNTDVDLQDRLGCATRAVWTPGMHGAEVQRESRGAGGDGRGTTLAHMKYESRSCVLNTGRRER